MLTYTYRAWDQNAQQLSGTIEARTKNDALRVLQREGKVVTDLRLGVKTADPNELRLRLAAAQVRREEVIAFASQMAVMLETGVPLADALDAFVAQSKQGGLKRVGEVIADRIHAGVPFSAALAEFPKVFPGVMVTLMRASEASGKMGMMLSRVADYLGKERRTARQIKGALMYPMVMVAVALAVTTFLVTWVLPRFARIYETRAATLPAPTRFVMAVSNFMITNWLAILAGLGAAILGLIALRMTRAGRRGFDMLKIRLPVIGPMFRLFYLTRATRTLGTLLASGVTLLDAVRIVRGVTNNSHWMDLWTTMETSMTGGHTIAEVVCHSSLIPPPAAQMISAGERTGRLPEVLDRVASATETDLDEAIKNVTQLIEPAMIIFMGLTIGGIAIALLLPIFNVANIMSH